MAPWLTVFVVLCAHVFAYVSGVPFKGYTGYRKTGVPTGLKAEGQDLTLNGDKLRILGGTIHYFRVPREYWAHRLQQLKANGLNTVETYVPWNLHEPGPDIFDFGGTGGTDLLDVRAFIEEAKKQDLLVILRPGPYICAEWDFGGLPSWLLQWENMQIRSMNAVYLNRVAKFYSRLSQEVAHLQFTREGPIIAVQIENEYGAYGNDTLYKTATKDQLYTAGFRELMFTSDQPGDLKAGAVDGVWMTVNGKENVGVIVDQLVALQPDKPRMVMEYWSGWFDHWMDEYHNTVSVDKFAEELRALLSRNAGFNFYVYHGGTNFGFLNGANIDDDGVSFYKPDVTSYDYDSLVSEAGVPTAKWYRTQEVLKEFGLLADGLPAAPPAPEFATYGEKSVSEWLPVADILKVMSGSQRSPAVLPMEDLRHKTGGGSDRLSYGQSYGFISYSTDISNQDGKLVLPEVHDRAMIFIEGKHHHTIEFTESIKKEHAVELKKVEGLLPNAPAHLEILVENLGRINYARNGQKMDNQKKGLKGTVMFGNQILENWIISPMEFTSMEVDVLSKSTAGWTTNLTNIQTPAAFRIKFKTPENPKDTFLNVNNWGKGVVFVNGRNIGRYWPRAGPQKTLYVPGVWLKPSGEDNDIILFELEKYGSTVVFQNTHDLGAVLPSSSGIIKFSVATAVTALTLVWSQLFF